MRKKIIIDSVEIRKHRLAGIWDNMKYRCYCKNHKMYKYYGGKGITVCDEWKNNYSEFYKWAIVNGYSDTLTLDRKNGNEAYSPENCKWSTTLEQANNRKNNCNIFYNGETKTLSEWARHLGITKYEVKKLTNFCRSAGKATSTAPQFKN